MRQRTQDEVSTVQRRIAELGQRYGELRVLNHHITPSWMREAYRLTRKDGASGVDGERSEDFAANLDANISELIDLSKSGNYRAPPVLRSYIPKGNGEKRPLGIPTFRDKVMQRAIGMLLEPIYEPIFHDCSYGFRPGRSAHDCVKALREELRKMGDCFVLDIDIRKYFDSIPKAEIRKLVDQRVRDKVVTRMIGKWLNAGVMEKGTVSYSTLGTPQGGVISPILSNIYLHYVLDEWFHETVLKHIRGSARLFRFADDFVIVCKRNDDAKRILEAVGKRLSKYGLNIHPDKSRLVEFRRPSDAGQSGGFNFLGFTFYWGKSRNKRSVVRVKSAKERMARILHRLWELCSKMRHCPIVEQQTRLNRVLRGHYNYYNVSFNQRCVWSVRYWAYGIWRYWLNRRAQRRTMTWEKFKLLTRRYPLVYPSPGEIYTLW